MTMLHDHPACDPPTSASAASVLREARMRLRDRLDAGDACGWAIAMLPQSAAAQCLMLDWLLTSEQHAGAATLAHTLLHAEGDNWRLWLRRSEALLALGRLEEAEHAIDRVLAARPSHRRPLLIKAEIALRKGDHAVSLHVLESADRLHPRNREIAVRLIAALLANGRVEDADSSISEMHDAPSETVAAVLLAQHRLLDARLVLQHAADAEADSERHAMLTGMFIDVLERSGDWPALRAMSDGGIALHPHIAARLAEARLAMGDLDAAQQLLEAAGIATQRRVHVAAAIASITGDTERSSTCRAPRIADPEFTSARRCEPWMRSMIGLIAAEQIDVRHARKAGADPSHNVLDMLLSEAITTLEAAVHRDPHAARTDTWRRMIDNASDATNRADHASGQIHSIAHEDAASMIEQRRAA